MEQDVVVVAAAVAEEVFEPDDEVVRTSLNPLAWGWPSGFREPGPM